MNPQATISTASTAIGTGVSRRRRGRRGSSYSSAHSSSAPGSYAGSVGSWTWLSAAGVSPAGVCSWAMTGSSLGEGGLLKAQRFDRSEGSRARRRVGTEEQAGQRRRAKRQEDRVRGDFRLDSCDLELAAE